MTDDLEPIVRGIQKRFRDLSVDVREERVIRYIVKQVRLGRHVDDIMGDAYLTAHAGDVNTAQVLQSPAVLAAIEEEIRKQFADLGSVTHPRSEQQRERDVWVDAHPVTAGACPTCGFENTEDSNFCRRCGSRLMPMDLTETTITYAVGEREEPETGVLEREGAQEETVLLIRTGGGREGETVALDSDVLTIGRSPHSDLFLDDVTVSRHHARVIRDANGFLVEDLNSLNGTYVNRKRIERHRMSDGDELQIGKFKLAFLEPDGVL
jgi:hypothetical protein